MLTKQNNFDLIRLLAALQVVLLHLKHHLHFNTNIDFFFSFLKKFPGVPVFFAVSGYLITASYYRNPNVKFFLLNRYLRIFPALYFCFILTFIILFYIGIINLQNIFSKDLVIWYSLSLFSIYPNITPTPLKALETGDPNGSLWTLPVEMQFYLAIPLLFLIIRNKKYLLFFLFMLSVIAEFYQEKLETIFIYPVVWKFFVCSVFPHFWKFGVGMIIYLYWKNVSNFFIGKFWYWLSLYLLCITISYFIPAAGFSIYKIVSGILLGALVISFAFSNTTWGSMLKGNDISYGVYIFHMPVANLFIESNITGTSFSYFSVILIVILLSIFSWKFIEKPFLKLKKYIPNGSTHTAA